MYLLGYIDDARIIYLQKMYLIPIDVHSIGILGVCHNDDNGNNHNDEDAIECWREGEKITALAGLWNPRQQLGRGPALMMMMMDGHGGRWTKAKIDHNHIQIMMELSFVWVTKTKLFPLWTWQFDRIEEKFLKHGEKKEMRWNQPWMTTGLDENIQLYKTLPYSEKGLNSNPYSGENIKNIWYYSSISSKGVTRLDQRHLLAETKLLISEQSETSSRLSVNQAPRCEPNLILNGQVYSSGRALLSLHTEPLKSQKVFILCHNCLSGTRQFFDGTLTRRGKTNSTSLCLCLRITQSSHHLTWSSYCQREITISHVACAFDNVILYSLHVYCLFWKHSGSTSSWLLNILFFHEDIFA